jgi:hypothetical protein
VEELSSYPTLYNEEQELLLYVVRIFGEFSRTPRISELNITNGIIPTCVRIMADDQKFLKHASKVTPNNRIGAKAIRASGRHIAMASNVTSPANGHGRSNVYSPP